MPRIKQFRDKVAAHFAASADSTRDSPAEQMLSVMPLITYKKGTFVASPFVLLRADQLPDGRLQGDSAEFLPWSLTGAHLTLSQRYWSGQMGQQFEVIGYT